MRVLEIAGLAIQGLRRSPLRVVLTTLGVTFAAGMLVTMVALSLGVQRQVETPFHALSLLNNIEVRPEERKGKERPPRLTDDKLAEMEKLPGVAAAYPDAHVKNIHLRYRGKETTAIGLAMPSEVGAAWHLPRNPHRRPLIGRRRRARNDHWHHGSDCPGVPSPQDALGKEITVEAADLTAEGPDQCKADRKPLKVTVVGVYQAPP